MIDENYLIKLKAGQMSDAAIARRLGVTEQEVAFQWADLVRRMAKQGASGHGDLLAAFSILCSQYQSIGESLKLIAGGINDVPDWTELGSVISSVLEGVEEGKVKALAEKLLEHFIILQPFRLSTPEEQLKQQEKALKAN